jgi:hypothetical protein
MAVLHTWTGMLCYHPHVHCLVTGGGVSLDGQQWVATRPGFFLPVRALSRHLRHLFQQRLARAHPQLYGLAPPEVWQQEWVVHCVPWEQGEHGVLDYLARYVLRIAITDRRILTMDEQTVTFRYQDRKAHRQRTCRLPGVEFVRRFLQHVLPKGFHKVRYYGLWHPQRQTLAGQVRQLLHLQRPAPPIEPEQEPAPPSGPSATPFRPSCPHCGGRDLIHLRELPRPRSRGP